MHLETRILITGGAGFLGSHLCERLLGQGADVICVDNFFTGTRRNINHLLDNRAFELVRHDVTLPLYLEVDQIYNLACPASPVHYQHDPVQTTKTSVHGAMRTRKAYARITHNLRSPQKQTGRLAAFVARISQIKSCDCRYCFGMPVLLGSSKTVIIIYGIVVDSAARNLPAHRSMSDVACRRNRMTNRGKFVCASR